jgi:hypothetical protein
MESQKEVARSPFGRPFEIDGYISLAFHRAMGG